VFESVKGIRGPARTYTQAIDKKEKHRHLVDE
jgi:hypothetical protein